MFINVCHALKSLCSVVRNQTKGHFYKQGPWVFITQLSYLRPPLKMKLFFERRTADYHLLVYFELLHSVQTFSSQVFAIFESFCKSFLASPVKIFSFFVFVFLLRSNNQALCVFLSSYLLRHTCLLMCVCCVCVHVLIG